MGYKGKGERKGRGGGEICFLCRHSCVNLEKINQFSEDLITLVK